jgi:hypothetical protein
MKYSGGGGGVFVKFEKIGDKHAGTVTGTREIANKMNVGTMQTVVDVVKADGTKITVALGPKALQAAWANAVAANGGSLVGRKVAFEFESTYKPKNGGNLGKEISVDVEDGGGSSPATAALPTGDAAEIEAAYKVAVEKKGEAGAAQILKAVQSVEKDPVKQAAMLLKAVQG